jgi:hypothetical protein
MVMVTVAAQHGVPYIGHGQRHERACDRRPHRPAAQAMAEATSAFLGRG